MNDLDIIIPYKKDNGYRDINFNYVKARYEFMYPDSNIIIGKDTSGEKEFCRSYAINDGVAQSNAKTILISDGDLIISDTLIQRGLSMVKDHPFCLPWGICYDLSFRSSQFLINGRKTFSFDDAVQEVDFIRDIRQDKLAGGIQLIQRKAFNKVGGYDLRFKGWGWEDTGFCWKIQKEYGDYPIIEKGKILHLWHPRSVSTTKNMELAKQIKEELGVDDNGYMSRMQA